MLTVSEEYKAAILSDERDVRALVLLDLANNWELPFCTIVASTTTVGYVAAQFNDGRIQISENGFVGDSIPEGLDVAKVGWKGTYLSDEDGLLATPEVITVTYNEVVSATNYWLLSDEYNYPVDFLMEVYAGSSWLTLVDVHSNGTEKYYYRHATQDISAFRLTITRISAVGESAFVVESGVITTLVFEDKDLMNIDLLEELAPEVGRPFGSFSSNECTCTIANLEGRFLPLNTSSPFYGLLRPSLRFRPYLGVEISDLSFECVPLGVFYSEDWSCHSNTALFPLSGYDALAEIAELDAPTMRGFVDVSLKDLIEILLDKIGYTSGLRTVDAALDAIDLVFGYLPNDKVRASFEQISLAGLCAICMDRVGHIAVRQITSTGAPLVSWTDMNMLLDIDNPQQFNDVYASVIVKYYLPTASLEKELLYLSLDTIVAETTWGPYTFPNAPIASIASIQLEPFTSFPWPVVRYGTNEMTLTINNNDTPMTITVLVTGKEMTLNKVSKTFTNTNLNPQITRSTPIDCTLIQSEANATTIGEDFLTYVSDPTSNLIIRSRGDPALELLDLITVDDAADHLPSTNAIIYRNTLTWDGALTSTISARKV